MEQNVNEITITLQTFALLLAAPLITFAVWADSYERGFHRRVREKEEVDRGLELSRVKAASLFPVLFQLFIFLSASELRHAHPFLTSILFITSLLTQGWIQASLERRIDPPRRILPGDVRKKANSALQGFLWISAAIASYGMLVVAAAGLTILAAKHFEASKELLTVLAFGGVLIGMMAGLALNLALAPFYLRRILPSVPHDSELEVRLSRWFEHNDSPAPLFHVLPASPGEGGAAFLAGLTGGRGAFRPTLFISESILKRLNEAELEAVILHEVAHLRLRHLRRRLLLSGGLLAGCTLFGVVLLFVASVATPGAGESLLLGPIAAIASLFFALRILGRQSRRQELMADHFAMSRLGADPEALIAALGKLDSLNGTGRELSLASHPATEARIYALRFAMALRAEKQKARQEKDTSREAA